MPSYCRCGVEEESVSMFLHCMEDNYFHADDELAAALVLIFSSRGRGLYLRDSAIAYGMRAHDAVSLVQAPNFCTDLLSEFMLLWGKKYLRRLLTPTINTLCSSVCHVEIDEDRLEKNDNLYDNAFNLLAVTQKLLNTIITSTKQMPKYVHDTITQMAIGMGSDDVRRCHLIITTFIFIRVICPALVLPQLHGLLPHQPSSELQRKLILVAKVLQNIAHQHVPSKDEPYLKVTREFTKESIEVVKTWATQLLEVDPRVDRYMRRQQKRSRGADMHKMRKKRLRPYLLKICAFMLSNEDQIRAYFEHRARFARDPMKISQVYGRFANLIDELKGAAASKTRKRKARRWSALRNLFVARMCTTPPVEQLKDSEEAEAAEETKCKIGHDVARVRSAQQQQQQQEQKQQQTLRALVNHRDDVESGDSTEEEGYNNGNSSKPKEVNRDDSGSSSSEALDGRGRQSTTKKKSKRQPYVIVLPTRTNIKKC